jgi:uncharacterized membrane protein YfcA
LPTPLFPPELLIAAALAFIGGIIRGYTGFGTPIFLAPTYAFLFGPVAAVALVLVQEIGPVLLTIRDAWKKFDPPEVKSLLIGCLPMLPVGMYFLRVLDPFLVRTLISLMTVIFVVALWWGWRYRGPRTTPVRMGLGAVSGFTTGLTGIGGPPVVLYYVSGKNSIAEIRANLVVYFSIMSVVGIPIFIYSGIITSETLWRCVVVTPPLLAGVALGSRWFHGTTEKRYVNAALLALLAGAAVGLFG